MIPEAEATGHCEIRPDSYVSRIETSAAGRATGVAFFDRARKERFQRARANSSGLVGKHLMFNYTSRALGVFEHELNEHKSVQVTRIVHDFCDSDPKRGFYGGGGLDARIGPQPTTWAIRTATEGPSWGPEFKARLREFPRSMQIACHSTSLPVESNNVTLDPDLKDAWNMPAISPSHDSSRIAASRSSRRQARNGSDEAR